MISMRTLLNLALGVIALGLGALIWLRPGLERDSGPQPLTTLDPQSVAAIELTRSAAAPVAFRQHAGQWLLDGALSIPADDFQVHTVLALLEAPAIRSYPARSLDLAGLGLDPPQASARFDATQIDLGNTEAIEGLRYVKIGARVYLVEDSYQHLLNAGLGNFASRRLLPREAIISALELPGLTLTRTDDVHWQLDPEQPDASADAIDQLVQNWKRASALYVRRSDPGEHPDTLRVTITGTAEPVVFHIVAREPDLVLARPEWGLQYHIPGDVGAGLLTLPEPPAESVQLPAASVQE
jgi:hypothetical protein